MPIATTSTPVSEDDRCRPRTGTRVPLESESNPLVFLDDPVHGYPTTSGNMSIVTYDYVVVRRVIVP